MIPSCASVYSKSPIRLYLLFITLTATQLVSLSLRAQTCPSNSTSTITTYPNTYYPGLTANLGAGNTSISLGAATYGTTPIASGDLLLLIQMQGSQIGYTNDSTYGKNYTGGGHANGYINNAQHIAGNMEYVVATNPVGLGGGTVNLLSGITKTYQAAAYTGGYGQYTYQVIRVASYYNLVLGGAIAVPAWNGATGGVLVLYVTNNLNMNGQAITAAGAGFRGGGGLALGGGSGGSNTYFRTLSTKAYNGSKGEGIAGTPRLTNNNFTTTDSTALEGYPVGSFGMGAPGNAGAGGTDGAPLANSQNSGGGGGSNGGVGGKGGNSWSSNLATGGEPGATFAEVSVSRIVMGGGGGAGTTNNATGSPGGGVASGGAAGGGIVIVYANSITGTGTINVNGGSATPAGSPTNDGSGGGGAGGSVVIAATSGLSGVTVTANGGTGGSNTGGGSPHGPGGGGGAGVIYASSTLNAASSVVGGNAGTTAASASYGAVSVAAIAGVLGQGAAIAAPMSCSLLPVGFLSVSANGNKNKVNIAWQVANETNVLEYVVEKSTDGIHFTPLGTLFSLSSGDAVKKYTYTDLSPMQNGTGYYRIRSIDPTAKISYSDIVSVKLLAAAGAFIVSPNPAAQSTVFTLVAAGAGEADIKLFDLSGRVCRQQRFAIRPGANTLSLEGLGQLQNGVYLLQCNDGMGIRETKLLIRH